MALAGPGEECSNDEDDIKKGMSYQCIPGYKCGRAADSSSSDPYICIQMYSIPDGEKSYDADFCEGGHLNDRRCVSIRSVR